VILSPSGGQTIQVPAALMTDAYGLWRPLNESERKLPRRLPALPPEVFVASLTTWLSPSETEEMYRYLYRLTRHSRNLTARVLARAGNYLPAIAAFFRSSGLPVELACLPMVESAFEPRAVSPAGAAGLWQLMPETARRYGLAVNAESDERFDVHKSTAAAAAYLAALHRIFNDWPLALAAYNCGEGTMLRALARTNTASLSELALACRVGNGSPPPLTAETLRFVPQFAAAVRIMANSDKFGLADRALLPLEEGSRPVPDRESPLKLVGRYEPVPRPVTVPARSKRME
jgi:membrane-bound lytic murein transglycosylase D